MQPELVQRAKLMGLLMRLPGIGQIIRVGPIPSERNYLMLSVFTTCWGTYGNGVKIGLDHIPASPQLTHQGRPRVNYGLRAGDASIAMPFTNERHEGIATSKNILRRVSVSGL